MQRSQPDDRRRDQLPGIERHPERGLESRYREFSGNLFCDISGASRIRMAGNAGIADIKASGASNFDGQQLSSRDCRIEASSASKVNTGTVLGDLTANGNSASSITYKGDPTIRSITISSASSIKKAL